MLIKPLTTKAYDSHTFCDCGTSGLKWLSMLHFFLSNSRSLYMKTANPTLPSKLICHILHLSLWALKHVPQVSFHQLSSMFHLQASCSTLTLDTYWVAIRSPSHLPWGSARKWWTPWAGPTRNISTTSKLTATLHSWHWGGVYLSDLSLTDFEGDCPFIDRCP